MSRRNNHAVDALTQAGFSVRPWSASEYIAIRGTEEVRIHLRELRKNPTPAQLEQTRKLPPGQVELFVTPRSTQRVRERVAQEARAWLFDADGTLVLGKTSLDSTPEKRAPRGRIPWGRYALMRALLREPTPRTQEQLAEEVGLTQGAVSGALAKLGPLAVRHRIGWAAASPHALWNAFFEEYPGAQGARTHWYSRRPFATQCDQLRDFSLLSADGGADAIAPWRHPTHIVAYAQETPDLDAIGFSPATVGIATVDLVMPADPTVFATARAWELGVADPLLVAWDLRDVGGNDALEAVDQVERLVLGRFTS